MKASFPMAARALRRLLILGLLNAWVTPLLAAEMTLLEEPTPPRAFAWTLVGASALSFLVAANAYTESQDALDEADAHYEAYQVATTEAEAAQLHRKTNKSLDAAVAYESTANGGLAFSILFGFAAWYAFSDDDDPNPSMILTAQHIGIQYQLRF